MKIMY